MPQQQRVYDLPASCLVLALQFLGDPDEVQRFACTHSAAAAFVRENRTWLKPDGRVPRQRFMDSLAWLLNATGSEFVHEEKALLLATTAATAAHHDDHHHHDHRSTPLTIIAAWKKVHLDHLAAELFSTPPLLQEEHHLLATSLRIQPGWLLVAQPDDYVEVSAHGLNLVRITAAAGRMEADADGGLDLMRYLRRLPLNLLWTEALCLFNRCDAAIQVAMTVARVPGDPGGGAEYTNWIFEQLSSGMVMMMALAVDNVFVQVDLMKVISKGTISSVALMDVNIYYRRSTGGGAMEAVAVDSFILLWTDYAIDAAARDDEAALYRTTCEGVSRYTIAGWPCRVKSGGGIIGYRIPMARINLCRLDQAVLLIKHAEPVPAGTEIVVYARGLNIAREGHGMLGTSFA